LLQLLYEKLLCHDSTPQTEGQTDTRHLKQQDMPYQRNNKDGRTVLRMRLRNGIRASQKAVIKAVATVLDKTDCCLTNRARYLPR